MFACLLFGFVQSYTSSVYRRLTRIRDEPNIDYPMLRYSRRRTPNPSNDGWAKIGSIVVCRINLCDDHPSKARFLHRYAQVGTAPLASEPGAVHVMLPSAPRVIA